MTLGFTGEEPAVQRMIAQAQELFVEAATVPGVAFMPGVHVNYQETVLPMKDGLPKMRDFPAELGGSGEAMAE